MRSGLSRVSPPLRAFALTFAVLALASGVVSGCGSGNEEGAVESTTTSTTTTEPGAQAVSGAQLFSDNCETCHGFNGAGGHVGPNLQTSSVAENLAQVKRQVRMGGGGMPSFSGSLSDQEIDVVARYVVEQIAPKG
jgi:mono/diheme cytochrome c family protein